MKNSFIRCAFSGSLESVHLAYAINLDKPDFVEALIKGGAVPDQDHFKIAREMGSQDIINALTETMAAP
jgi:hypothetical protein